MYKTMPKFAVFSRNVRKMLLCLSLLLVLMWSNSVFSERDWSRSTTITDIIVFEGGTCRIRVEAGTDFRDLDCKTELAVDCQGSRTSRVNSQRMLDLAHSAFLAQKRVFLWLDDEVKDGSGRCYLLGIQVNTLES